MKTRIRFKKFISISVLPVLWMIFLVACNQASEKSVKENGDEKKQVSQPDSAAPENKNWLDVQSAISKMDSLTKYDEIVKMLGKPYDEYATPSLQEEYVMFYDVPGVNGAFFWIMLDTEKKTFLYWSGEKSEK